MIIIKIIILYFIQIRNNDDFPSTGTRLVVVMVIPCIEAVRKKSPFQCSEQDQITHI